MAGNRASLQHFSLRLWDGCGVILNVGGPYRLRCIHSPRIGEVIDVDVIQYWMAKKEGSSGRTIRFEPVSDDEKLWGPIFPKNFPSDIGKARSIAARSLRKDGDGLTFADLTKFSEKRKTTFEIAH